MLRIRARFPDLPRESQSGRDVARVPMDQREPRFARRVSWRLFNRVCYFNCRLAIARLAVSRSEVDSRTRGGAAVLLFHRFDRLARLPQEPAGVVLSTRLVLEDGNGGQGTA